VRRLWKTVKIYWKQWDDGTVVFNALSGSTHLLNPTAAIVLKALEEKPANATDLAQYLASKIQVDSDQELIAHVENLLSNLDELGLIEMSL
jgi:PqqD family protein of HPr-rel-A system